MTDCKYCNENITIDYHKNVCARCRRLISEINGRLSIKTRKEERLAFADWLENLRVDELAKGMTFNIGNALSFLNRIIFRIEAKIKELRSNPLQQQSVDGNRKRR